MGNKPIKREDSLVGELCQFSSMLNSQKFKLENCEWKKVYLKMQPNNLEIYQEDQLLRELGTQKNLEVCIDSAKLRVTLMFIGKNLAQEKWILRLNSYDFKLFIAYLKYAKRPNRNKSVQCQICTQAFTVFKGKRNCKQCGRCVCKKCGRYFASIPELGYSHRVRICVECKRLHIIQKKSPLFEREYSCIKPKPNYQI